jgi:hypothetical protein
MKNKGIKVMLIGIILILISIFMNGLNSGGISTGFIQFPIMLIGLAVSVFGVFIKE